MRITPGHHANIGEKDTLFKDRETPKTIPYSAAHTYIAHISCSSSGGIVLPMSSAQFSHIAPQM